MLLEEGRADAALCLLRSVEGQFHSSEYCADLYLTLGHCYLNVGRARPAIRALQAGLGCPQAAYSGGSSASLWVALADAYLKTGRARDARAVIRVLMAMELEPADSARHLSDLLVIVAPYEEARGGRGRYGRRILEAVREHASHNKHWPWLWEAYERLVDSLWDEHPRVAASTTVSQTLLPCPGLVAAPCAGDLAQQ